MRSMIGLAKKAMRAVGANPTKVYQELSARSIVAAVKDQGLEKLLDSLRDTLPDISDQYTHGFEGQEYTRYWEIKMRGLHAFQVSMVLESLNYLSADRLTLADVGDSSGNHAAYVAALAPTGKVSKVVSVNLDPVAVEKVKSKGGDAIQARAEELDLDGVRPDLVLSFEMLEHLTDPVRFLHSLATGGSAEYVLISVPFRRVSQFGGWHLRLPAGSMPTTMTAEDVHVYEFCPSDWKLLARFAGFETILERIYFQYPRFGPYRMTAPLWRKLDFEGFVAFLLKRDLTVSNRYLDW